ncbi:nitrilase family protein [Zhouia amylolytica]|uniref:nitrilase family protein n=1 Tax=Zhouia amylolytica TaxID=376730 RepID=UPI0020CDFDA0|nr:nitrilase family protein [Zhouia amylolytica]MCQ0111782.1 nitrilase family protein [Zhouia amylolytica]
MSQDKLKVALIQTHLLWENPKANRKVLFERIEGLEDDVDLIILPEMFTSGFTMNPEKVAEDMGGTTILALKELASKKKAAISGSLVVKDKNSYYNRLVFVYPSGSLGHYDKRHTFTLAGEDRVYGKGDEKTIIQYKGWKLCPQVCYDLRFPVWSRNTEDYDVLYYVANWPEVRIGAWDTLLKARAIENMSYVMGVNRIGLDGNGYNHSGHSAVYDALGNQLNYSEKEEVLYAVLTKSNSDKLRNKLRFLEDRDDFNLV